MCRYKTRFLSRSSRHNYPEKPAGKVLLQGFPLKIMTVATIKPLKSGEIRRYSDLFRTFKAVLKASIVLFYIFDPVFAVQQSANAGQKWLKDLW